MNNLPRLFTLSVAFTAVSCTSFAQEPDLLGFTSASAAAQMELEKRYDALLRRENLRAWMKSMTTRPHHVGSPKARENAEFMAEQFRSWGYDTGIEVFHVLFPTPKTRELELLFPAPHRAELIERIVEEDSASRSLREEGLPPFNAYSAEWVVVGDLVYVNHGVPKDYEELERRGIDVRGRIVIARYGGCWRGIKPKVAAEKGAVGCIIYNDPDADGFAQGDAYPKGAFKHDAAVQRGSVVDLPLRPGDPLTPGYGATKEARRLEVSESETIMKIPVLPISYRDALPFFRAMRGPLAPSSWRGAMPVTYRLGGDGSTKVRLKVEFNWGLAPAYNVVARLKGSVYPDQWVLRGNHHDAWVIGARDPISGAVTVLEQARAIGALVETGWRPRRTLVFCLWDAEEPGLLGSTEWVEHHAKQLREKAVCYINTDGNSRGFLRVRGSHSLERLVTEVTRAVSDPQTGVSVSDRLRAVRRVRGTAEQKKQARDAKFFPVGAMGSGSDYTAFLQHLGVPSLDVRFGGEGVGGEYHTMFDTYDHYSRFIDPGYDYGVALTRICGRLMLRLAEAEVLPFDFQATVRVLEQYTGEVRKLADTLREETTETNQQIEDGLFELAADPTKPFVAPKKKEPVPHINFAPLLNGLETLRTGVRRFEEVREALRVAEPRLDERKKKQLNQILYRAEQALTHEAGLPRRPWFRHLIYAPGFYTGYGVKTLPGVRESIEERQWDGVEEQIARAAAALRKLAGRLDTARRVVESARKE